MDITLSLIIANMAAQSGVGVDPTFSDQIDHYINKHYSASPEMDRVIIESYLSDAALRIARTEGKQTLEAEDAKAAVWLFHQPDNLTSTCAEAGAYVLREEGQRIRRKSGVAVAGTEKRHLSDKIRIHLDELNEGLRP